MKWICGGFYRSVECAAAIYIYVQYCTVLWMLEMPGGSISIPP